LAVGACRDELDPVETPVEWGGGEEAADLGVAFKARGLRGHREKRVVGEERDDAVEIDRCPGLKGAINRVASHAAAR